MLRIVFSIMVLMLCGFALADNYHVAKNTMPASVSGMIGPDSGLPEPPDLAFPLRQFVTSLATIYSLNGRVPSRQFRAFTRRIDGNMSIRSPPLTL